jgi:hypothetical protein
MRSDAAGFVAIAGMIFGMANASLLAQTQQTVKPAQATQGIAGTWQGTVGQAVRIVLKISKAHGDANNGG